MAEWDTTKPPFRTEAETPLELMAAEVAETRIWAAMGIAKEDWDQLGPQARRIISKLIPEFAQGFVEKSLHYGAGNPNVLGPAGQFADIWRKIGPLKRALWEGEELTQEGPDEICKDLIGHSLLTIDMLRQGVGRRGTW